MSLLDALRSLIVRGSVTGSDPSQQTQALNVAMMVDEDEEGVENFAEPYGLANALPAGTECIIVSVGGAADHQVVVGTADKTNRPTDLEDGEVALYTKHGQQVWLKNDGSIHLIPKAGQDVTLGEQKATVAAALEVAIASKVETELTTLKTVISAAAVSPMDGGATFKANIIAGLAAWPGDTSSPNVKAKI